MADARHFGIAAGFTSAFMVGEYEAAIEMADRAVALNPNSLHGMELQRLGLPSCGAAGGSNRSFERAIRMSPVDPMLTSIRLAGIGFALLSFVALTRPSSRRRSLRQNPCFRRSYRCLRPLSHLGVMPRRASCARVSCSARSRIHNLRVDRSRWVANNAELLMRAFGSAACPNETGSIAPNVTASQICAVRDKMACRRGRAAWSKSNQLVSDAGSPP